MQYSGKIRKKEPWLCSLFETKCDKEETSNHLATVLYAVPSKNTALCYCFSCLLRKMSPTVRTAWKAVHHRSTNLIQRAVTKDCNCMETGKIQAGLCCYYFSFFRSATFCACCIFNAILALKCFIIYVPSKINKVVRGKNSPAVVDRLDLKTLKARPIFNRTVRHQDNLVRHQSNRKTWMMDGWISLVVPEHNA